MNPLLKRGKSIFAKAGHKSAKTLRIVFSFFGTEGPQQARLSHVARVSERSRRDVLRQPVHACCLGHVPSITTRTVTPHISLDIMEGSATGESRRSRAARHWQPHGRSMPHRAVLVCPRYVEKTVLGPDRRENGGVSRYLHDSRLRLHHGLSVEANRESPATWV